MTTPKPLSPAAQAVRDHFLANVSISLEHGIGATLRAAAAQMIKTDDLTDTVEGVIRRSELHHQAGLLCTIATELEGSDA